MEKNHHHYTALSPSLVWNILVDCCSKKFHDDGLILSLPPSLPPSQSAMSLCHLTWVALVGLNIKLRFMVKRLCALVGILFKCVRTIKLVINNSYCGMFTITLTLRGKYVGTEACTVGRSPACECAFTGFVVGAPQPPHIIFHLPLACGRVDAPALSAAI